ncbi:MAG TPA: 4Fe-4S dicluster domain-containing protein, partial [Candidatus Eremiobacteraceae bacterium]|nr:4Fe-4S dicluster domain-containing protein [Candidatus Eremiobacteraceae bacterium]
GCGYCVTACPFGVIETAHAPPNEDGGAHKCTLCYDRLKDGMEHACAKACPTDSIIFGDVEQLRDYAQRRVDVLHARGEEKAQLYGMPEGNALGGLNSFFLLLDEPERYNLPRYPRSPKRAMAKGYLFGLGAALVVAATMALAFDSSG